MKKQIHIPNSTTQRLPSLAQAKTDFDAGRRALSHATRAEMPHLPGAVIQAIQKRRRPGILDRISSCESREAAYLVFHEFLDSANSPSQKTLNRANRLLATLKPVA